MNKSMSLLYGIYLLQEDSKQANNSGEMLLGRKLKQQERDEEHWRGCVVVRDLCKVGGA